MSQAKNSNFKADFHIHTGFSCDSEANMEESVKQAISEKMQMICFTEHVDFNPLDYGYHYYNPEEYFREYHRLKELYGKQIKICSGIEFGEPHVYPNELGQLSKYPYDCVIGSIHWVGNMFPTPDFRKTTSAEAFFGWYWEEVLNTVKCGGFDALGHIDFPKRYYGELYYSEKKIRDIFKYLLEQDMIIEINTSSLRKGLSDTMPGADILEIYKACGGKYVTIGSDAHFAEDVGADNETAKALIKKLSLQEVIFEQRKKIILSD